MGVKGYFENLVYVYGAAPSPAHGQGLLCFCVTHCGVKGQGVCLIGGERYGAHGDRDGYTAVVNGDDLRFCYGQQLCSAAVGEGHVPKHPARS